MMRCPKIRSGISAPLTSTVDEYIIRSHSFLKDRFKVYNVRKDIKPQSRAIDFGGEKTYKVCCSEDGAKLNRRRWWKASRETRSEVGPNFLKIFAEKCLAKENQCALFILNLRDVLTGYESLRLEGIKEAGCPNCRRKGKLGQWGFSLVDYTSYLSCNDPMPTNRTLLKNAILWAGWYKMCDQRLDEIEQSGSNQKASYSFEKITCQKLCRLYGSHADLCYNEKSGMAKTANSGLSFLEIQLLKSKAQGLKQTKRKWWIFAKIGWLKKLKMDFWPIITVIIREGRFLADELLRPLFQLEKFVDGVSITAKKLGWTSVLLPTMLFRFYHQRRPAYDV